MNTKILYAAILLITACTIPQDPQHSFKEAKEKELLVGVINNPPFVDSSSSNLSGSEVQKLKEFARQENLRIKFLKGNESDLIHRLEKYELHVVIGGFDKKTIWKKKAGLTVPYDEKHVFLIPKGENRLLEHLEDFIFEKKTR